MHMVNSMLVAVELELTKDSKCIAQITRPKMLFTGKLLESTKHIDIPNNVLQIMLHFCKINTHTHDEVTHTLIE